MGDEAVRYPFLIRADQPPPPESAGGVEVRMNLVIGEVPFGDGRLAAHVDTSGGSFDIDIGLLEKPDLTLSLAYDTARALLVDGDAGAAMTAFMGGRIRVDGDITKLLALQTPGGSADAASSAAEIARRLQEITE
jgi:SCP-2 sterol transfer family